MRVWFLKSFFLSTPIPRLTRVLLLMFLLCLAFQNCSCGGDDPDVDDTTCGENSCNEKNNAGTCDDSTGKIVCTCSATYLGDRCNLCASGWHLNDGGACIEDAGTPCEPLPGGAIRAVQVPVLRTTLPASWDENWFASPAVVDLDNDGDMEIVAARHSVLYAWEHGGTLLWRAAFGFNATDPDDHASLRMYASPAIGDFDNDGDMEIAVASSADDQVAVYDHHGMLLPGWPQGLADDYEARSITAGDLDGDGEFEIVVNKTNQGPVTSVFQLDGMMRAGWPQVDHATCDPINVQSGCYDFGGYNQNIGLADMDGDGYLDVISSYDSIVFGIFHRDGSYFPTHESFADRVITGVPAYHDLALSQQGWGNGDRSEFTDSPPVMADVDRDGVMELILAGDHEHSEDTTNLGVTFWLLENDMTRPAGWEIPIDTGSPLHFGSLGHNIVQTTPAPSVGDMDDEPTLEILAPAYDGKLYAFNADGSQAWSYVFATTGTPYTGATEAILGDLNGDGIPEIIFNTFSSGEPRAPEVAAHLIILNNNGALLHKIEISYRGSMAPPSLADLDGDGDLELILSLKDTLGGGDGGVQIWDIPGSADNCLQWPTGRGGMLRQGRSRL